MFDQAKADEICRLLASGKSLRRTCDDLRAEDPTWPHESTVRLWALEDTNGFATQYTRARELQAHTLADEVIDISDTTQVGQKKKTSETGEVEITEGDMIEHRRLRVDARKWYLSKVLPKVYGDRTKVEHDVTPEGPLHALLSQMGKSSLPVAPQSDDE